jgi:hypothetical protein
MRLAGVFGLRRKAIGRLLFPIDRHFSIESGLKRWERDGQRSGSRWLPGRGANLPDGSWFPSIGSRTFKKLYVSEKMSLLAREGARFLRRISWARAGDNGGMDLSTWLDFSKMRVLVFFLSRKRFHDEMEVDDLSGGRVHKNFSR